MSYGEKTYEAMRKGVIKALEKSWHIDWQAFAGPAYAAFIEDMRDDASVRAGYNTLYAEGKERKNLEFELEAYIDDDECTTLGKPRLLSDILCGFAHCMDVEETERLVANSMAAFREKAEKLR